MRHYVPGLHGIRALSAVAVAAMHFGVFAPGWIGVQFFYVLSGFLITDSLLQAKARFPHLLPFLKDFYRRRALRILPLYLFYVLLVAVAALAWRAVRHDWSELPYLLTYTYNFRRGLYEIEPGGTLAGHLWSLSVEEQFYLAWPFLIFFASRRSATRAVVGTIAGALVFRLLYALSAGHSRPVGAAIYFLTPFQVDGFAFGALLSLLPAKHLARAGAPAAGITLLAILATALLNRHLAVFGLLWPPVPNVAVWIYSVIDLLGALLVLECIVGTGWLVKVLETAPLRHLGRISYGFYIWHWLVITVLFRFARVETYSLGHRILIFAGVAAVVTLLAELSYRSLERPMMQFARSSKADPLPSASLQGQPFPTWYSAG